MHLTVAIYHSKPRTIMHSCRTNMMKRIAHHLEPCMFIVQRVNLSYIETAELETLEFSCDQSDELSQSVALKLTYPPVKPDSRNLKCVTRVAQRYATVRIRHRFTLRSEVDRPAPRNANPLLGVKTICQPYGLAWLRERSPQPAPNLVCVGGPSSPCDSIQLLECDEAGIGDRVKDHLSVRAQKASFRLELPGQRNFGSIFLAFSEKTTRRGLVTFVDSRDAVHHTGYVGGPESTGPPNHTYFLHHADRRR